MLVGGAYAVSITLNAGSGNVSQTDPATAYDTTVGIRFNTDGTIETGKEKDNAGITWTGIGNWINPAAAASSDYDVRFTNFNGGGGGDWTTEAAADDTWIDLGAQRIYTMNSTSGGTISFTCDFEVRDGGGAPPVTGSSSYTFSINNIV